MSAYRHINAYTCSSTSSPALSWIQNTFLSSNAASSYSPALDSSWYTASHCVLRITWRWLQNFLFSLVISYRVSQEKEGLAPIFCFCLHLSLSALSTPRKLSPVRTQLPWFSSLLVFQASLHSAYLRTDHWKLANDPPWTSLCPRAATSTRHLAMSTSYMPYQPREDIAWAMKACWTLPMTSYIHAHLQSPHLLR